MNKIYIKKLKQIYRDTDPNYGFKWERTELRLVLGTLTIRLQDPNYHILNNILKKILNGGIAGAVNITKRYWSIFNRRDILIYYNIFPPEGWSHKELIPPISAR